jgi:hypothetical protein
MIIKRIIITKTIITGSPAGHSRVNGDDRSSAEIGKT